MSTGGEEPLDIEIALADITRIQMNYGSSPDRHLMLSEKYYLKRKIV
jgi:hypothetical protein